MALAVPALPFGLRDVKVTPIAADGTLGTSVDLPAARTFSFAEAEDYEELRGDDEVVTTHGHGPNVNWTLEAGGISLEALKVLAGGTLTTTGITPALKKTFGKAGKDSRPFFQVEGQAISDSGGDVHCIVYKCKAEGDIGGDFADASFFLTSCSGRGIPGTTDKLYDFVNNETAVGIT